MSIKRDAVPVELAKTITEACLNDTVDHLERVWEGRSTYVYRVRVRERTLYLRMLPEAGSSFGVEVTAHALLKRLGVQVPEVICFEPLHPAAVMSIMVVKEISGESVLNCDSIDSCERILYEAGKQLALIHQVKVDGYGWIRRGTEEDGTVLRGDKRSLSDCICEYLDEDIFRLSDQILSKSDAARIQSWFRSGMPLMARHEPRLAHGDFDDSHIYCQAGKYTGIIDFGEMQGMSPRYDLGRYKLHDGQSRSRSFPGYAYLAEGYAAVTPLTGEDELEIGLWALWIGVRRFGMVSGRKWGPYHELLASKIKLEMEALSRSL